MFWLSMWHVYKKVFSHSDCHSSLDTFYLLFWLLPASLLCITVITVKQAFGNHRLLAGYDTKPIEAGLGRDNCTRIK